MMSSGVLKPQDMLSTNTFKVELTIHSSLGHTLQLSTECQIKEEPSEFISDAELEQLYTEGIVTEVQEEQCVLIDDNYQRSHLEDPIDIIKEEVDDVETDAEYINLAEGNIKIEENGWEPEIAGLSSQSADNICPKIVKVVLERIDLNGSRVGCFLRSEDLKRRRQATEKTSITAILGKLNRNKEAEAECGEPRSIGARVSKKLKIAALKDTEDATTNKRKIEEIKNKQTETVTIKEPIIVTKKIDIEKSISASKTLKTCDKSDNNLIKCDDNILTSVVHDVCEQKSTNHTFVEQNVSSISSKKKKLFSCDTCNKCFSYKYLLKNHILTHTAKPYQCNVCKKCFSQTGDLKTHIRTHTGEKPYQCNVCKKCFSQTGDLKTHIRTHTGEKPYQCNVCNKCFNYKNVLKTHIRTHTGDKPYQCNVCKKCFSQQCHFKTHFLTHTGEKPYQCNVCNKCFNYKNVLKTHIRTHTGDKPYQCNVCKKCFSQQGHFKTHFLTHTGEKSYQCNVCKKCFSRKHVLISHIRTHTGEKPYQCNVCKKCFTRKDQFKSHTLSHTGQKSNQCNVCKKCFSSKNVLIRHFRTHTGENPYQCNVCKKCFTRKDQFKSHTLTHTGEKPIDLGYTLDEQRAQ